MVSPKYISGSINEDDMGILINGGGFGHILTYRRLKVIWDLRLRGF